MQFPELLRPLVVAAQPQISSRNFLNGVMFALFLLRSPKENRIPSGDIEEREKFFLFFIRTYIPDDSGMITAWLDMHELSYVN